MFTLFFYVKPNFMIMNKQEYYAYFPTTGETKLVKFNPEHIKQAAMCIIAQNNIPIVFIKDKGSNKTLLICTYVPVCSTDGHFHFFKEEETV